MNLKGVTLVSASAHKSYISPLYRFVLRMRSSQPPYQQWFSRAGDQVKILKNIKVYKNFFFLTTLYPLTADCAWDKHSLLNEARVLMKYDGIVAEPIIIPKTKKQLENMFCEGKKCVVSAIYTKGFVYYDKKLDPKNIIDHSILVHEMIHHIQRAKWGNTHTCSMWMKKEKQAYKLQILYLHQKGYKTDYIKGVAASIKCPD